MVTSRAALTLDLANNAASVIGHAGVSTSIHGVGRDVSQLRTTHASVTMTIGSRSGKTYKTRFSASRRRGCCLGRARDRWPTPVGALRGSKHEPAGPGGRPRSLRSGERNVLVPFPSEAGVDHIACPPACEGGLQARTERSSHSLVELGEQMAVPVKGDVDRGVAHPGLNGFGWAPSAIAKATLVCRRS